jgi:hypothetical protein
MRKNKDKIIAEKYNKIEFLGEGGYGRITKCSLVNSGTYSDSNTYKDSNINQENKYFALKKYFINRVINI